MGYHDSSNLYAFAKNDPVNNSDPTGEVVPILAYLGWVGVNTAVDVGIDYAFHAALAPQGEEFDWGRSIASNLAINAAVGGLGHLKQLKHLEDLKYIEKLDNPFVRSGIDIGITGTVNMEVYDQSALQAYGSAAFGRGVAEGFGAAGRRFWSGSYFHGGRWRSVDTGRFVPTPYAPTFGSRVRGVMINNGKNSSRAVSEWWRGSTLNFGRWFKTPEVHHIVGQTHRKAAGARAILDGFGLDVEHPLNKISIPYAQHRHIHTDDYFSEVEEALSVATTADEALAILQQLRRDISRKRWGRQ
ncbi:MAG: AHH domain-containing protein [Acidobacteria bacterium]|nr:AHH domain-containing protein [Acidobacteriota bacterium]